MSLIYEAELVPTKAEIIAAWLPTRSWFNGDVEQVEIVGGYRFDDPAGEVGIQGQFVTAGSNTVYHVPLTYRGAALEGAEEHLMGTMQHSVLGERFVYDAIGDPVFQNVLARVIAQGGTHADEFTALADGSTEPRPVQGEVFGSGIPDSDYPEFITAKTSTDDGVSSAFTSKATLAILRLVDPKVVFTGSVKTLKGTWETQEDPVVLATLRFE